MLGGFNRAPAATSLVQATMNGDKAEVRQLIASGANLEDVNHKQETALILAAKTDQFEIAELLIGAGANVLAVSTFGWTAGYAAQTSRLERGPEAAARLRVIEQLKSKGVAFSAPHPADVMQVIKDGGQPALLINPTPK